MSGPWLQAHVNFPVYDHVVEANEENMSHNVQCFPAKHHPLYLNVYIFPLC